MNTFKRRRKETIQIVILPSGSYFWKFREKYPLVHSSFTIRSSLVITLNPHPSRGRRALVGYLKRSLNI